METQRYARFFPFILFAVAGLLIGIGASYIAWSSGAANFAVVSTSKEAIRTVRVGDVSVTFPSVIICKAGADYSVTIGIANLKKDPVYVVVSLAIVRNNGVDSGTVSFLTGHPYTVTLAAYGSANDILSFKPSSTGYALFDIMVNGELAGATTLYVVPT